jgi:hypothetical protein
MHEGRQAGLFAAGAVSQEDIRAAAAGAAAG